MQKFRFCVVLIKLRKKKLSGSVKIEPDSPEKKMKEPKQAKHQWIIKNG